MKQRMADLWRPDQGMEVNDLGDKLYLFQFHHINDMRWVLDRGPWIYNNVLMVLHELQSGEIPTSVLLTHTEFWIQVHNLSAKFCTERVGKILGDHVGTFVKFDENQKYSHAYPYMSIRVLMDVTGPLKIDRKVRQPGGEWLRGKYRYEKLPTFCFVCGRIGHVERHCPITYRTKEQDIIRRWDASLRADIRRPVQGGGEQWLINTSRHDYHGTDSMERNPLCPMTSNDVAAQRPLPVSVLAARRNLGVSVTRPLASFEEDESAQEDIEGIEVMEVRKRRREGKKTMGLVDSTSSRSGEVGTCTGGYEYHDSSFMVQASPGSGTCPSQ
ncbi:Uncharacterized protein At4g02000 [Linum grandiflorum]